ncbi:MAG: phage minor capsid protein [Limosilactobacillus mucosae]
MTKVNCRHILFPYVPGVNENHQPQYDPKEAIKNGKLVQQQRARERAIRDAKRRLKAAEKLDDKKMIDQTKTLLRARQAKLRDFIKETNVGKEIPILVRDYTREKISDI